MTYFKWPHKDTELTQDRDFGLTFSLPAACIKHCTEVAGILSSIVK